MSLKDNLKTKMSAGLEPVIKEVNSDNYHLTPHLKREFEGIAAVIKNREDFGTEMGHRNFILEGPPGTGKTLGLSYLATETGAEVYDGKSLATAADVSSFFKHLRSQASDGKKPVFGLINEIDKFSKRDGLIDPSQQQVLNQLLDEMDGSESNDGIFLFGTTNKPNNLDEALRRGKRFSREVSFMPPDKEGREKILKIHAEGRGGHKFKVDTDALQNAAKVTFGYTGADLVALLNESFTNAILDNRKNVTQADVDYALKLTKPSALKDMPFREPNMTFADIGGYQEHVEVLRRIVNNSDGSTILIYGPKGTGKSTVTEALAGEYGFNYMVVSGSSPEDKFVGETSKTIDRYIDRAKQLAPCVLLFDEMDALVEDKSVYSHKGGHTGTLQSRLSKPIPGVYIFGTTNRPHRMSGTLRDRFLHKMLFGMPTREEQALIWKKYVAPDIDIEDLLNVRDDLSGRDISMKCRLLNDYGIEPTQDAYKHLLSNSQTEKPEVDYGKLALEIGDGVSDFKKVIKLIGVNNGLRE